MTRVQAISWDTRKMTASWPADWAEPKAGRNCPMCANQGQEDNGFGVRFLEGEYADVFLQRLDLCLGYSIAIWKHGHVAELTELSAQALAGFTAETVRAAMALEDLFTPAKVNFETLGNSLPHLHTHIVLRYLGDPAPGKPLLNAPGVEPRSNIDENRLNQQLNDLRSLMSGRAAAR
jgi:diadenosine tetraphosphate (Ap4A) HIT family hydrolase